MNLEIVKRSGSNLIKNGFNNRINIIVTHCIINTKQELKAEETIIDQTFDSSYLGPSFNSSWLRLSYQGLTITEKSEHCEWILNFDSVPELQVFLCLFARNARKLILLLVPRRRERLLGLVQPIWLNNMNLNH